MDKDKDKQKEANRVAAKKYRDSMTDKGMTVVDERPNEPSNVIPKTDIPVIPERTALGNIRVSKPGDDDYVPMCETTRRFLARTSPVLDELNPSGTKEPPYDINIPIQVEPKRGEDIKTFADLPPDVQATINRISQSNEEKQKRTKAAIKYQHLFPDRFHSTGYAGTPNLGQAQTAEIGEAR